MHSGRAAELGSRGGRRRTIYSPEGLKDFAPPKTAADLRDLIAQSIIEIRTGKLDPKLANSISYLGTGFLRAERRRKSSSRNCAALDLLTSKCRQSTGASKRVRF